MCNTRFIYYGYPYITQKRTFEKLTINWNWFLNQNFMDYIKHLRFHNLIQFSRLKVFSISFIDYHFEGHEESLQMSLQRPYFTICKYIWCMLNKKECIKFSYSIQFINLWFKHLSKLSYKKWRTIVKIQLYIQVFLQI